MLFLCFYIYHCCQFENVIVCDCLYCQDLSIIRGRLFDTWGAMVFFRDQTFSDSKLKGTIIFFRPYQKQTVLFSAVEHKTIYYHIFHFDPSHTILSSWAFTTFTWTFTLIFDKESYYVEYEEQNCCG